MTKVGNIYSLFYATSQGQTLTKKLLLDQKGILKDNHYDKNIERSVLLTSLESYRLASQHTIDMAYGTLGENILMDYNPYMLTEGTRLKIGDVILEISQLCTLCIGLSQIDTKLPKLLKHDRGIFSKVIVSGSIYEGDDIYISD